MRNRLIADVYVIHKGKKIWVNEYMRQILAGKKEKDALEKARIGMVATIDSVAQIAAQGYCTKRNGNKILDPNLLYDIAKVLAEEFDIYQKC